MKYGDMKILNVLNEMEDKIFLKLTLNTTHFASYFRIEFYL